MKAFWIFCFGILGLFLITFPDSVRKYENCKKMNGIQIRTIEGMSCISKDVILK